MIRTKQTCYSSTEKDKYPFNTIFACVTFEGGETCCDNFRFKYKCCPMVILPPHDPGGPGVGDGSNAVSKTLISGNPNSIVEIRAPLCCIPETPLRVSIADTFQNIFNNNFENIKINNFRLVFMKC